MLTLKIDGVTLPIADKRLSLPTYNSSKLTKSNGWREGSILSLGVVSTPETDTLMGHAADLHRNEMFNDSYHTARLEAGGICIYEGVVTLNGVEQTKEGLIYLITIHSGGAEWADTAAVKRLNRTALKASNILSFRGIEESWSDDSIVRMLPLKRDSYPEPEATGLYTPQRTWMTQDYHPFISVKALLNEILSANGYTLRSKFLNSEIADKLMISGAYHTLNTQLAKSNMDFKALRSKTTTAKAGEDGRVSVWEPVFGSNIGAIVDTVNPMTIDENGNVMSSAYSKGGCFTFEDGRPKFTPRREISVAFDIHLRYTTDFRIVSSHRLRGFDTIHISENCEATVELQNTYIDHRNEALGNQQYNIFIFDYNPNNRYFLTGFGEVRGPIYPVTLSSEEPMKVKLYELNDGDVNAHLFTGDWALYDGHVTGEGERDVEITIRTPFNTYTPSSPMLFNNIFFAGADPEQSLTLAAGCSVTPVFSGAPGYGEHIEFEDVANIDISQMELLEAIAHMFNLRIYSHRPTKQLYVEPYDDFFNGEIVDWQERQLSEEYRMQEGVIDIFEHNTLGYQSADGVSSRTKGSSGELGRWSLHVKSYGAKHGVESRLNPLFSPTVSLTGVSGTAPSAEVLTIGDRDAIAEGEEFEPRIVLYHGIATLPYGQMWGSPSGYNGYPLAAFHSESVKQTLCFEDRDGCSGLHRYYDRELNENATRGTLTCQIYICPSEYMALFDPEHEGATLRSRFRLSVGGNTSLFRLDSIEEYDIESMVAICRFKQLLDD